MTYGKGSVVFTQTKCSKGFVSKLFLIRLISNWTKRHTIQGVIKTVISNRPRAPLLARPILILNGGTES